MNDEKLTDEFPPEIKPVHRGVYPTRISSTWGYSRWDGRRWSMQMASVASAKTVGMRGGWQQKFWRGLAEKP